MSDDFKKAIRHPIHSMYSITECGRVYSHKSDKELKPFLYGDKKKIRYYAVSVDGKNKKLCVLVLETYIGKRPKGFHAAHLDGNPLNDRLSNLKWVSPKENEKHKIKHGTKIYGPRNGATILTPSDVKSIRKRYKAKNSRVSNAKLLSNEFGVSVATICSIVKGRTWTNLK